MQWIIQGCVTIYNSSWNIQSCAMMSWWTLQGNITVCTQVAIQGHVIIYNDKTSKATLPSATANGPQNVIYNICTAPEPTKAVSYCHGEPVKVTSLSVVYHPRLQNHLQTWQRLKQITHNVTTWFRKPSTYLVKTFSWILVFQLHTILCVHSLWLSKGRVS